MVAALAIAKSTIGSAIIGSITTKTFDSLVTSRFTQKSDKRKWIREKTLHLFSELSSEVTSISCDNLEEKRKNIKNLTSRINLITDNKKLRTNLENYSFILDEYECYKSDINLEHLNEELIEVLKIHVKRM